VQRHGLIGYAILSLFITDYSEMFLCMCLISAALLALALFKLDETLGKEHIKSWRWSWSAAVPGFSLYKKDIFLLGMAAVVTLLLFPSQHIILLPSFLISVLDFQQNAAIFPGIARRPRPHCSPCVGVRVCSRTSLQLGLLLLCAGYLVLGVVVPTFHAWLWVACVFLGMGAGFFVPSYFELISTRVESQNQGKLQGVNSWMAIVGIGAGAGVFSSMFNAHARGLEAGVPFDLAAAVVLAALAVLRPALYPVLVSSAVKGPQAQPGMEMTAAVAGATTEKAAV
jgi:hypothetical protein